MPRIPDITRAIRAPALNGTFQVERRAETINDLGRSIVTAALLTPTPNGVICPTAPRVDLTGVRRTAKGAIRIHTVTKLLDDVTGYQPDIVIWREARYIVIECNPWEGWGSGFYDVYAELQSLTKPE